MNRAAPPARTATGRPLLALAGLVTCWVGARVAIWELPATPPDLDRATPRLIELTAIPGFPATARGFARIDATEPRPANVALARIVLAKVGVQFRSNLDTRATSGIANRPPVLTPPNDALRLASAPARPQWDAAAPANQVVLAAHPLAQSPLRSSQGRWSADVWLALREGGRALFGGGGAVPVYGASQAEALLRYRLAPDSSYEPVAYGRAVQALDRREGDLAAGLAARVAPRSPVVAHIEARISRRGEQIDLRPAAFLTAGFQEQPLAVGFQARGYGQAGYVGGRDATAFIDGNAIAEREVMRVGEIAFAAGAGLWGGAQRGAARFDVGPSASLRFPLTKGTARLSMDYRLRVAGNAQPASGAALTLSAGF